MPARAFASAIWTGDEIIIWGGSEAPGGKVVRNDGWIYHVASNRWRTLPTSGPVPGPRSAHAAVWTGREMLVFGGYAPEGKHCNDLWAYDPRSALWRQLFSEVAVLSPRGQVAAVWTGREVILAGGMRADRTVNTSARFHPASHTWRSLSPGAHLAGHSAVWTGTEMLICGGFSRPPPAANRLLWQYEPESDAWTQECLAPGSPPLPEIESHSAVWTGREMILFGGTSLHGPCNQEWQIRRERDGWHVSVSTPSIVSPRSGHSSAWTGQQMFVWGGCGTTSMSDPDVYLVSFDN